jgi:hypothetical protein
LAKQAGSRLEAAGPRDPASCSAVEPNLLRLRVDLAEALRAKGQLQCRLNAAESELADLRSRSKSDSVKLRALTGERNALLVKVRDRNEELRDKSKLVEVPASRGWGPPETKQLTQVSQGVQDELIALTLQLNLSEQAKAKTLAENKDLIARWMKWKGAEADAMNRANEPHRDPAVQGDSP